MAVPAAPMAPAPAVMAVPMTGAEDTAVPMAPAVSKAAAPTVVLAKALPTAPAPYPIAPEVAVSTTISPAASPADFLPRITSTMLLPRLNPAPAKAPDLAALRPAVWAALRVLAPL